ncbi:MAG: acyltransferase family protein [Solirubrobacterales bacterium]|nr:acyltransferase family protein [Solirubrobacterales bacterium]
MPRPAERGQRYVGGLDGIRAVAVLCVIAYHLNVPWAKGGMLGVGVFFTLSGYLITDLLLGHYRRRGNFGLRVFWLRRARRLLPALFLMLFVVSLWVALFDASQLADVRRQVISAALYFANWSTIAAHGSYFARFAAPLPLDHLWSLSIEEQFYLLWPWLLVLGVRLVPSRRGLALLTLIGAAASALLMGSLYHPGYDPTRVYEGTDTRAFGLLLGAALAMVRPVWISRPAVRQAVHSPAALDLLGLGGLIGVLVLVWRTSAFTPFVYPLGFVLLSLATIAMIAAVVNPSSALGVLLGCAPLRWIGVRSYGIYLWQWPIVVLWGQSERGVDWPRAALQVAVTMIVASLSWRYVEQPIRGGALRRLWRRARSGIGDLEARRRSLALTGATLAALLLTAIGLAGALPVASAGSAAPAKIATLPPRLSSTRAAFEPGSVSRKRPVPAATHTACRSVVYIGDSTSEGEISSDYIASPERRLQAQLARVGVTITYPEISGARSVVETYEGYPNGATVAQQSISEGFRGCWILALGTNDVADVNAGSTTSLKARINRMMSIVGRQPVMWVDLITLLSSGPYAENAMQQWNKDLLAACPRYSEMRVYDWAAHAKRKWFIPDGIHYYSPGYIARNHDIARGLVKAFPRNEPPSGSCLVG